MAHHDSIDYPQLQNDPNEYAFTAEELKEIDRHAAKYPDRASAVMPALWIAQEKWGWLPQKAIQLVADTVGVSYAQAYGVATFYTMYLKENMGKNLIEVCTCFTCGECGGKELYNYALKSVNADENGVSPDKLFYIREAECLGACDTTVPVQVNNRRIVMNCDEKKIDHILAELRAGKELAYEAVPLKDQSKITA